MEAFESHDMDRLTALLTEDACWSMPPYPLWLQTHDDIRAWRPGPASAARGRSGPGAGERVAGPRPDQPDPAGGHGAWSLQVLEVTGDRICGIVLFLDVESIYPRFDLPLRLG